MCVCVGGRGRKFLKYVDSIRRPMAAVRDTCMSIAQYSNIKITGNETKDHCNDAEFV